MKKIFLSFLLLGGLLLFGCTQNSSTVQPTTSSAVITATPQVNVASVIPSVAPTESPSLAAGSDSGTSSEQAASASVEPSLPGSDAGNPSDTAGTLPTDAPTNLSDGPA